MASKTSKKVAKVTRTAKIEAALSSSKGKTTRQITEETGCKAVYNHLNTLRKKDRAFMNKDGLWLLVKQQPFKVSKPGKGKKGKKAA